MSNYQKISETNRNLVLVASESHIIRQNYTGTNNILAPTVPARQIIRKICTETNNILAQNVPARHMIHQNYTLTSNILAQTVPARHIVHQTAVKLTTFWPRLYHHVTLFANITPKLTFCPNCRGTSHYSPQVQ
jgi:hypothetical protein